MTRPDDPPIEPTPLESEAYDWVIRFTSGAASRDDIDALKRWVAQSPAHAVAFDQASRAWQALGSIAGEASSGALAARAAARPPVRPRMGRRAFLGGALAASAAGAAVMAARPPLELWPSWSELAADYRTNIGEQRRIKLFERVSIDMNTRTSIVLRSADNSANRIELLAGEAMVSTPPDASGPFTVVAADGRIVAGEARFNVRYDARSVCVTCLQGEVRVELDSTSEPLLAGRQVVYSDRRMSATVAADAAVVSAWQDGILIFHATPVADVIAEVNRYRRGKIILTNAALGRERFSARFRIENIDRIVGQIEQVFGARATVLPGGIALLG